LYDAFAFLATTPEAGHVRRDLTRQDVLFWPVRSYLEIYHPQRRPIAIVAVLHGKRDVKNTLRCRRAEGTPR
jgi:antitoxin ParD1/3/4/toxin ParE1/3/4